MCDYEKPPDSIGSMAKHEDCTCDVRNRTGKTKIAKRSTEEEQDNKFVVSYQNQFYDIHEFLHYHPGGKKVLSYFKNRSLDKALNENPHSKAAFHLLEDFTLNNQAKYQEYEDLIDWNGAIFRQVGSLRDQYWEWVNLPVNRPIRLFQSDFLEILSITPWYLIPVVWIPVFIYFLYSGWMRIAADITHKTLLEALIFYILGILIWSISEYVLHRKVFHFQPPATSKLLISLHFILHGIHHKAPFDSRRLVFPPIPGLIVAILIRRIYETVFPEMMIDFIAAGTTTGYICYDLIHYYLHYGAPKTGSYFYLLKRNHNYHHFVHHDLGFGVCSKLWDHAFGTSICLRPLTKPIEW